MRVKYIGESDPLMLLHGKVYDVMDTEKGPGEEEWYRVIDETGEDYLYHYANFEIVQE